MNSSGDLAWILSRDGDPIGLALFRRHYSFNRRRNQLSLPGVLPDRDRNADLFVGPGEKMVLITCCGRALFVWRKFRSADAQEGVNCAVFRNEGAGLSSDLIRQADTLAWERWPGQRLYTYVNPRLVKSPNPGYCFQLAGWVKCGRTKCRDLIIITAIHPS